MIKTSYTRKCHKQFGHSSQTTVGDIIRIGGIMGIDPNSDTLVPGGTEEEIKVLISNMTECLGHAFTSWSNVLKMNIYLTDINDFDIVDKALSQVLVDTYPVYTVTQVSGLLGGAHVCIDCEAAAF